MAVLERLINGERAATPKVVPAPNERRNPLRDAIIVSFKEWPSRKD
jgi:hypothetical protein